MTAAKRTRKKASAPKKVLVLRTCNADMTGNGGFVWPTSGAVVAPDWDPNPEIECGSGLHGLAWGDGDWSLPSKDANAKWLVVEVESADLVLSQDKSKARYRAGNVVCCGTEPEAVSRVMCCDENFARLKSMAKGTAASSGDHSTAASSGDHSTAASSGNAGIAAAIGNLGLVHAGPNGLLIACWWDNAANRYRACVGEVGIDGIEADTDYRVVDGKLEKVTP